MAFTKPQFIQLAFRHKESKGVAKAFNLLGLSLRPMVPHLKKERSIVPYFTARKNTLKATSPYTRDEVAASIGPGTLPD